VAAESRGYYAYSLNIKRLPIEPQAYIGRVERNCRTEMEEFQWTINNETPL
jgi:hypothetical protein